MEKRRGGGRDKNSVSFRISERKRRNEISGGSENKAEKWMDWERKYERRNRDEK